MFGDYLKAIKLLEQLRYNQVIMMNGALSDGALHNQTPAEFTVEISEYRGRLQAPDMAAKDLKALWEKEEEDFSKGEN
jgi:hypothetical protein